MTKGFFVVGTDTGVGKTVVTAGLVGALRAKGVNAVPFKPVQSGAVKGRYGLIPLDVEFYKKVCDLPPDEYNTYALEAPLAPSLAAEISRVTIERDIILKNYAALAGKYELIVVEGAGGLYVPLSGTSFLLPDLIKALNLPLIIVARANLGTINHTVLTVKCAQELGLVIKGIIYNGYNADSATLAEKTNPKIIEQITGVPTLGVIPKGRDIVVDAGKAGNCLELIENHVNFSLLLN
ncbi:MAG: dethiobiotin synthase [Bacillota bacterium]|uniref:ATP-dependent dethiobiotin synthetase BioD n=1 Tax=Thermanaerosceptrum fracticalcis TaxID=1712410 RepID=A0A7G6E0K0_THEFR|nr:dethiobiotin synthase [Thermanaerosceptrum fracticalcis]QNB45604.1 dethiobiotin synthase [Thermanaerosceptrum fracticalcis]